MDYIIGLIYQYGLTAMFLLILLEYACFPVSSEIVLPLSGAIASLQGINLMLILPLSVLAGMIGVSICYFIGKFGGNTLLPSIKKRFPKTEPSLNRSMDLFERMGLKAVFFGRMIPICRTYISFIAGVFGLHYISYLLFSAMGIAIWNTILISLGYLLGDNWELVKVYYAEYKLLLFPLLLLLLLFLFRKKLFSKKQKNPISSIK